MNKLKISAGKEKNDQAWKPLAWLKVLGKYLKKVIFEKI